MKIIDDEAFFEYQTEWFKAQFQKGDPSGVWKDHKQVMFAYKIDKKDGFFTEIYMLRDMLNDVGIKRLNNAISARKKRLRKTGSMSIQMNVPKAIADKFNLMCQKRNLTQSDMFEKLLTGEVQMDMFN